MAFSQLLPRSKFSIIFKKTSALRSRCVCSLKRSFLPSTVSSMNGGSFSSDHCSVSA
jgi:hypothetical protein